MENNTTEIMQEVMKKKGSTVLYSLKIGGILLAVCSVVALVLSFVDLVTKDQIAANEVEQRRGAIVELFGSDGIEYTELDRLDTDGETVEAIYRVAEGGETLGYCASVLPVGFGGEIQMMVAMKPDRTIIGVKIISLSETPGLGTRVNDEKYLARYVGKGEELAAPGDIELISGATKSSKAVLAGVNAATAALAGHLGGGAN